MLDPKAQTRKTIVKEIFVIHRKPDDGLFPAWMFKDGTPQDVWDVLLTVQSGLLPRRSEITTFLSEDEANAYVNKHPVGSEIDTSLRAAIKFTDAMREKVYALMDAGRLGQPHNAGDMESPLAFDVLKEAGLIQGYNDGPDIKVLTSIGKHRLGVLKNKYGDNWTVAAVFEYCIFNLPESSPAYVAAAYQYHYYITEDDFAAGYWWRDLECLVFGVESTAIIARDMRTKASKAAGEKSSIARCERRIALLSAMESVAERNPDVLPLGAKAIAGLGLARCVEESPSLWTQGQGQVDEYLGEIRRGEAGEDLKARFFAMFPLKPPKRLKA
ncbi:hypothetical protein D2T29_10815 [Sinirhodobacter populi]|uniref:Uncharacterized protein n=1 Tax=Paenirhodobacter populi TaxID=2306993 RepID=A0A443KFH8_9RHOB|nr:hypothetical protein [Sinirhodobacter populi]RWR31515.1 hypothetical protein D2T29_10815 [Sinirhodobacter populi]